MSSNYKKSRDKLDKEPREVMYKLPLGAKEGSLFKWGNLEMIHG